MQIEDNASYIEAEEFPLWCFFFSLMTAHSWSQKSAHLMLDLLLSAPKSPFINSSSDKHDIRRHRNWKKNYNAWCNWKRTRQVFLAWKRVCAGTCFAVWKLCLRTTLEFRDIQLLAQKLVLLWKYQTSFREIFHVEVSLVICTRIFRLRLFL